MVPEGTDELSKNDELREYELSRSDCTNKYSSSTVPTVLGKVHCTMPRQYDDQYNSSTMPIDTKDTMITVQPMAQPTTSFRTTTPSTAMSGRMTTKQVNPVHQETSHKALLEDCMHVHQPAVQVCKPGESLALRSQAPTQWKDFCEQTPIDEARHSVTTFWLL